MAGKIELRGEAPWKYAGRWIALSIAVVFGVFAALLVLTSAGNGLLIWLAIFVAVEMAIYLFSGPLYRPRVMSVVIREEGLAIRESKGTEVRVPFSDVKRIASSSAACTVLSKSGAKHMLGFGFGGAKGDSILGAYKVWAERNEVDLMEFHSRDGVSSRPVKNLEVYERR